MQKDEELLRSWGISRLLNEEYMKNIVEKNHGTSYSKKEYNLKIMYTY